MKSSGLREHELRIYELKPRAGVSGESFEWFARQV